MFNQLDMRKHFNETNKDNGVFLGNDRRGFEALSETERATLARQRDKRNKLFFRYNIMPDDCSNPASDVQAQEASLIRWRFVHEVYDAKLELSGLNYGTETDCKTSRIVFVGGTGRMHCRSSTSFRDEAMYQGKYCIRDTGNLWRIDCLNDVPVNIEFAEFEDAVITVIEHYRNLGAIPLSRGIAALRLAGLWETHTLGDTSRRLKLLGGTNHECIDNTLQIEHEFSVDQEENRYTLEKLDGEVVRLVFGTLDDALAAVLTDYEQKNLTEEVFKDPFVQGIWDPLPETATDRTPPKRRSLLETAKLGRQETNLAK